MLEHAAVELHRAERRRECTAIAGRHDFEAALAHDRPRLARRMCHHRPRPRVQPRVARLVPRLNVGQAVVDPVRLDIQSSHHHVVNPKVNPTVNPSSDTYPRREVPENFLPRPRPAADAPAGAAAPWSCPVPPPSAGRTQRVLALSVQSCLFMLPPLRRSDARLPVPTAPPRFPTGKC